jgi:ABC-type phosphate transport system substrate-binding protein
MKRSTMVAIAAMLALLLFVVTANYSYLSAQTNPSPTWALNPQQTTLTAEFSSVPPATLALNAAEVDNMIVKLAEMRAAMKPPRPAGNPAPGTKISVATAGNWYVQADGAGIDLVVFHPGYGWVGLYMDRNSIEQLNRRLALAVRRVPVRAKHFPERR